MAKSKNIELRGTTYYVRVNVPKNLRALRQAAGLPDPAEVKRSLRTGVLRKAEIASLKALADLHREFSDLESLLSGASVRQRVALTPSDIDNAAEEIRQALLNRDERERLIPRSSMETTSLRKQIRLRADSEGKYRLVNPSVALKFLETFLAPEIRQIERERILLELRANLAHNNFSAVAQTIEILAENNGWFIESHELYATLARALLKVGIAALEETLRRDKGDYSSAEVAVYTPETGIGLAHSARPTPVKEGQGIRDLFEQYMREEKQDVVASTLKDLKSTIRLFVGVNADLPVESYTKDHMSALKRVLKQYPRNASKLYPGLSVADVIKKSKSDCNPLLSIASVNNKLAALSAFGKWLENNKAGLRSEAFSTTLLPKPERDSMPPFSLDEIKVIFNSHAFTGAESPRTYKSPGSFKFRDWHFFIPLIAAFSGARLNEIAQLRVDDIRQQDGIWVFDVSSDGKEKSLKTKKSKRLIPIHPKLIELGLLDYVERARKKGWVSLFEDINPDTNGRRSTAAGSWFRKFLTSLGVKADSKGGSHRFRHTVADRLRAAGVEDHEIAPMLGHTLDIAKMTSQYGMEHSLSLARRADLLAKIEYPGVDWDSICF